MKTISWRFIELSGFRGDLRRYPDQYWMLKALDEWQADVEEQLKALRAAVIPTGNYSLARVNEFIEGRITRAELLGPVTVEDAGPHPKDQE